MTRLLALAAMIFVLALPQGARAQSFNAQEQAEIRAVVRDYLVRNPDVLREALAALDARVTAERRERIENDPRDFVLGRKDAPITVVEFFDYRCSYCAASLVWVREIARTRSDVRIVFKELPILGPSSLEASRASVAAAPQGRYWAFHQALISYRGELSSSAIDQLARNAGVDVARMRARMNDAGVTEHLQDNQGIAIDAGVESTPTFMVNGEIVRGADNARVMELIGAAARAARR